jgi:hypothetical protein
LNGIHKVQDEGDNRIVPGGDQFKWNQSCRPELERDEGDSEELSLVAVCGGCPMLQTGATGNIDWLKKPHGQDRSS